jgi:DNA-directed RNA polymerase sigma subunit (sigma70/sigma32)
VSEDDEFKGLLDRTWEELTPLEREALKKKLGIEDGKDVTLAEITRQFDITRAKIREIEHRVRERHGDDSEGSM